MTDVAVAEEMIDAIRENRIELALRSICAPLDLETELYRECVSRVLLRDGETASVDRFVGAIRRLGLACVFDQYIVQRAIRLLRGMPDVRLGVRITGSGAESCIAWEAMFIELSRTPDVAARLVIEIDDAASIAPRFGRRFGTRFKQLGCRLAIDHFGAWGGPQVLVGFPSPDIVKVDISLLRVMGEEGNQSDRLKQIVAKASSMRQEVVAVGIDSRCDLVDVARGGVRWVRAPQSD